MNFILVEEFFIFSGPISVACAGFPIERRGMLNLLPKPIVTQVSSLTHTALEVSRDILLLTEVGDFGSNRGRDTVT